MKTRSIKLPVTFYRMVELIQYQQDSSHYMEIVRSEGPIIVVDVDRDSLEWMFELSEMLSKQENLSSNYRATARRAWWRLKNYLRVDDMNNTDVISVGGVTIDLNQLKATSSEIQTDTGKSLEGGHGN